MKKMKIITLLLVLTLFLTGCTLPGMNRVKRIREKATQQIEDIEEKSKEEFENIEKEAEKEVKEYKEKQKENAYECKGVEIAYKEYKKNHKAKIVEGFCSKFGSYENVYFKVSDELIYNYTYDFDSEKVTEFSTENYAENKKECEKDGVSALEKLNCTRQDLLYSTYKSVKRIVDNEYKVDSYAEIDVSKLK